MKIDDLGKKLLYLYNSCIFLIIPKKGIVKEAYYEANLIAENISFIELGHLMAKTYDLKDIFYDKIDRFMSNLNNDDGAFYISLDYEKVDGSKVPFVLRGYQFDTDDVMFSYYPLNPSNYEIDELTKTISKNRILSEANLLIEKKESFIILRLGIDDFDVISKNFGHMFSDIVLIETVSCIKSIIGNNGYICRIGESEFSILLKIADNYDVIHDTVASIRHSIEDLNVQHVRKIDVHSTIGLSRYPYDGDDLDTLLKKAEIAYQRGITKGKNCFIIYTLERSGPVPEDYQTEFYNARVPVSAQNYTYNVTSGIIELLNQESELRTNVTDALSVIGNFFLLDRITYVIHDEKNDKFNTQIWHNPSGSIPLLPNDKLRIIYDKMIDNSDSTGMIKYNQVESNKTNPLYETFHESHTSAILSFVLKLDDKVLGVINYSMCSINRFWSRDEISALRLLSNVFAVEAKKQIDANNHYKDLYIDPSTGIINYKKWKMEINTLLKDNPGMNYSLLQIQIADFHNIRSIIGNRQCEKIYCSIADKLGTYVFSKYIYCHDSDDKFMVFFPNTNKREVTCLFDEVSTHIFNNSPVTRFRIILQGGAYINDCNDKLNVAIDKTAIAFKNSNNSLTYYSNEVQKFEQERTQLELHMHDALKNNEFLLYLQPKVDSNTGKLVGAEALTRWHYYHEKLIFPNVFIPMFEENGFIEELDFAVFENTCKFLRKILDEEKTPVPISLNVSRYVSDFKEYLRTLNRIKRKYKIPDELIELEITEGMFYNNDDIIANFIDLLHEFGYTVLMDDFGSGYSNISSLATLNFDCIKLDKSLVQKTSEKQLAIISSLIAMIKQLNMSVLCEGVETKEIENYLKTYGCNIIQGYLYDKPLPEEDFKKKYIK